MLKSSVVFLSLLARVVSGQTLSACNVLDRLSELNGQEITVRGLWGVADSRQSLIAIPKCASPMVRDGWVWKHALQLEPFNGIAGIGKLLRQHSEFARRHPSSFVVATFQGRLETVERYHIRTWPDGTEWPDNFSYFAARLRVRAVNELSPTPVEKWFDYVQDIGRSPIAFRKE